MITHYVNGSATGAWQLECRDDSGLAAAKRLAHFARHEFDPTSEESFLIADRLWRDAITKVRAERRR